MSIQSKYAIGEMLYNRQTITKYVSLGLCTTNFTELFEQLLFEELIENPMVDISDLIIKFDTNLQTINDFINFYQEMNPKLLKKDVVNSIKKEKNRHDLKLYLIELIESINHMTNDEIQAKISKIDNVFNSSSDDLNQEQNKVCSTAELLNNSASTFDYFPTPYNELNDYFNFVKGNLIIVGSRPSIGKSALCLDIAIKTSKTKNILYVNMEMSHNDLMQRMISNISGVEMNKIKFNQHKLTKSEQQKVKQAKKEISKLNFNVLSPATTRFQDVMELITEFHNQNPIDLLIIDYLTLLSADGQNKNVQVEYMANKLKSMSLSNNICTIAVSQLSRNVEAKTDKMPTMADLRDSGGVEQAADIILLLYRDDYYNSKKADDKVLMQINLAKNRQGERSDNIYLGFIKSLQKFKGV